MARVSRLCRHCQQKKANRPRGLCWTCYYSPFVLALYPSSSKYASKRPKRSSVPSWANEPRWYTDPERRKQRCIACFAGLYIDEPGQWCQDCRGALELMHRIFYGRNAGQRALWGPAEIAAHEARVQSHAERVLRECRAECESATA